jgi:TolA-binding protein
MKSILTIFYYAFLTYCLYSNSYASFDFNCSDNAEMLTVELQTGDVQNCAGGLAGTYLLNPYNDSRINLLLLLEDAHLASFDLRAALTSPDLPNMLSYEIPFRQDALINSKPPTPPISQPATPPSVPELPLDKKAQALGVETALIEKSLVKLGSYQSGHCVSNNAQAVQQFFDVLNASSLAADEKRALATARLQLAGVCADKTMPPVEIVVNSPAAKELASYVRGAASFYNEDFKNAETEFKALLNSTQPWLKETATYLLGRIFLNDYNGSQAEAQFKNYLAQYPKGLYSESAQGLFRRVYWLDSNIAALSKSFMETVNDAKQHPLSNEEVLGLANEIDAYLFFPMTDNPKISSILAKPTWDAPLLSAVAVLTQMRNGATNKTAISTLPEKQAVFAQAGLSDVYDYLLRAEEFFTQHDYAAVIQHTPSAVNAPLSNVAFSSFSLRALSHEALKQWEAGEKIWLSLLEHSQHPIHQRQLQLALALNYEKSGRLARVFAENSRVTDKRLQRLLIERSTPPDLLEKVLNQAHTAPEIKAMALKTLLLKNLIHTHYSDFLRVYQKYPSKNYPELKELQHFQWAGQGEPEYVCPTLLNSVHTLSRKSDDALALNCVSEFLRLFFYYDYYTPFTYYKNTARANSHNYYLGERPDLFKDKAYNCLDFYLAVINNPKAEAIAKAFALSRALNCFATSGNNHCGTQPVEKSQRVAWFKLLKSTYKSSVWAEQQKYYW